MSPDPGVCLAYKGTGEVWGWPVSDLVIPLSGWGRCCGHRRVSGGRVDARTCGPYAGRALSGVPKADDAVRADPDYESHVRDCLPMRCVRRHDLAHCQSPGWRARQPPRCRRAMTNGLPRWWWARQDFQRGGAIGFAVSRQAKPRVALRAGGHGLPAAAATCLAAGRITNRERPLPSLWRSCRSTCRPRRRAGRLRVSSHPPSERGKQPSPCAAHAPMTYELFLIGMARAGPVNLGCVLAAPACGRGRRRSAFNARDLLRSLMAAGKEMPREDAGQGDSRRRTVPGSLGNHGRKPARCMHALYENVRFL
jgi:hypothetical protein